MAEKDRGTAPDRSDRFIVMYDKSLKQGFELAKHLTTLNAGSIVLIATFLKDIFPNENGVLGIGSLE
jgi:hypothetical protein